MSTNYMIMRKNFNNFMSNSFLEFTKIYVRIMQLNNTIYLLHKYKDVNEAVK